MNHFVTDTDWNTRFSDYDSLNDEEKDHYMIGAQAEEYMHHFKKLFGDATEEIASIDGESNVRKVRAIMETLRMNESKERDAVKKRVEMYLRGTKIAVFPKEKSTICNHASNEIIAGLSPGKQQGVYVVGCYMGNHQEVLDDIERIIEETKYKKKGSAYYVDADDIGDDMDKYMETLETYQEEFYGDTGSF